MYRLSDLYSLSKLLFALQLYFSFVVLFFNHLLFLCGFGYFFFFQLFIWNFVRLFRSSSCVSLFFFFFVASLHIIIKFKFAPNSQHTPDQSCAHILSHTMATVTVQRNFYLLAQAFICFSFHCYCAILLKVLICLSLDVGCFVFFLFFVCVSSFRQ